MILVNLYFSLFLLVSISSILVSNPVLSVLCLVFVFVLASTFIVAIGLDYLGILLLLIYVGAISVLFLFVVMMLNVRQTELNQSLLRFWWLGGLISIIFFLELILCSLNIWHENLNFFLTDSTNIFWIQIALESFNIELIGEFLFQYNWDFLVVAILLLLVAVLGPVYVSQIENSQEQIQSEKQNSWEQIIRSKIEIIT